jgi:hypothetical protein
MSDIAEALRALIEAGKAGRVDLVEKALTVADAALAAHDAQSTHPAESAGDDRHEAVAWHNPRADALRSALREIADTKNLTATPAQFARWLQRTAETALTDDAMAEPELPHLPKPAPLTEVQVMELATKEFPRWQEDIQARFVIRLARAIEKLAHGIKP